MRGGRIGAAVAVLGLLVISGCGGGARKVEGNLFYLALGASDAVGIGASPLGDGYVYRIGRGLEGAGQPTRLLNTGIPGARVEDIRRALELVLDAGAEPHLVTLWTGANDLIAGSDPGEFEEDLEKILESLEEETDAFVVIADLPDLTRIPRFVAEPSGTVTRERVDAFNAAIRRQAEDFDVPVAKLSEVPLTSELTSDVDGFHPSDAGHRAIAETFLSLILPAFGLK